MDKLTKNVWDIMLKESEVFYKFHELPINVIEVDFYRGYGETETIKEIIILKDVV